MYGTPMHLRLNTSFKGVNVGSFFFWIEIPRPGQAHKELHLPLYIVTMGVIHYIYMYHYVSLNICYQVGHMLHRWASIKHECACKYQRLGWVHQGSKLQLVELVN